MDVASFKLITGRIGVVWLPGHLGNGVAIWRVDGAIAIDRKHLRPGDLLFFGSADNRITHTGMFVGHGQFIHDTTNGHPGVQISRLKDQSLDAPAWSPAEGST